MFVLNVLACALQLKQYSRSCGSTVEGLIPSVNDSTTCIIRDHTVHDVLVSGGCSQCFYRVQEEDIRRRTSAAGINADAATAGLGGGGGLAAGGGGDEATQELAAAVESLPKLLDQKKGLEMHTNILKVACF